MPKHKPVPNKHLKRKPRVTRPKTAAPITATTFPASAAVPGQAKSRASLADFQAKREQCPWWREFVRLQQETGLDWRKAAYIAWASSPYKTRWPATLLDLCSQVLGCSDRVVRKWREMNPAIDKLVAAEQIAPLMLHRSDVINALIEVASRSDTASHSDRKLFLELTGDYKPKSAVDVTGEVEMLTPEEIEKRRTERWEKTGAALAAVLSPTPPPDSSHE